MPPSLASLERNGIIRIIDLVFILKDTKGNVAITEAKDLGGKTGDAFSAFAKIVSDAEWFTIDDIEAIAVGLPNDRLRCYSVIRKHLGNPLQESSA